MATSDEHPMITLVRVYTDTAGKHRWTAYAANGEPIAVSSESYTGKQHAEETASALFPDAAIEEA